MTAKKTRRQQLTPEQRKKLWEVEDNAGAGWRSRRDIDYGTEPRKPNLDDLDAS